MLTLRYRISRARLGGANAGVDLDASLPRFLDAVRAAIANVEPELTLDLAEGPDSCEVFALSPSGAGDASVDVETCKVERTQSAELHVSTRPSGLARQTLDLSPEEKERVPAHAGRSEANGVGVGPRLGLSPSGAGDASSPEEKERVPAHAGRSEANGVGVGPRLGLSPSGAGDASSPEEKERVPAHAGRSEANGVGVGPRLGLSPSGAGDASSPEEKERVPAHAGRSEANGVGVGLRLGLSPSGAGDASSPEEREALARRCQNIADAMRKCGDWLVYYGALAEPRTSEESPR